MNETNEKYAVIVAGGSGQRMKSNTPKQFIELAGKTILMHTITKFKTADSKIRIIVVLPAVHLTTWKNLCEKHHFTTEHEIRLGGNTRFQSVKSGISNIPPKSLVAVHDGVRPFTSLETIENSYKIAYEKGNAIAAVPLKDSIREINKNGSISRNRANYRLIQTPQTFKIGILKDAYQNEDNSIFTDDASVVETAGYKINLIEGSYQNIKITTPEDMLLAKALLSEDT